MKDYLKILLLEDSKLDAELIKKELTKEDYTFETRRVETRDDFINEIKRYKPDLILSDYSLPQFDGITALGDAIEHSPETPIIIVTGSLSEETAAECIKSGAWDYVVKERLFRLSSAIINAMNLKEEKDKLTRIEENRKKYEFMINTFSAPLTLVDRNYIYEAVNEAFCIMQKMSRKQIIGNTVFDIWSKENCDPISRNLDKAFAGELVVTENWLNTKAYGERYLNIEYIPYYTGKNISHVIISSYDITERKRSEEAILKSLREKEVMLKEIHHRVKNNLQIISSLLHMQIRSIVDEHSKKLFFESINRVKSMALIHENLYHSENLDEVNFQNYINRLVSQLSVSHNIDKEKIKFHNDIMDTTFNINLSIPLGLILNEILNNSLRYAFPDNRAGEIKITSEEKDGICTFVVEDNGIGISDDIDLDNNTTLGLQLIRSLTAQLKGTLETDFTKGTKYKLSFKK